MQQFDELINKTKEVGYVSQMKHGIVHIEGLPQAHTSEVLAFESGQNGIVLSLQDEVVEALLLEESRIPANTKVARTGEYLAINVSNDLLGKVISPIGVPLNAKSIKAGKPRIIDTIPGGIDVRKEINQPLSTGVSVVDIMVPLAKGQRELVVGDRKTGKTQFLMQSALNHTLQNQVCVYAAIAKRTDDISDLVAFFSDKKVLRNMVFVATSSAESPGMVYLTPYSAMTVAEFFRDQGMDVLIILDDLTVHAKYYREISLLAQRFPGRSSYPGDIFYTHARLLERAGNFTKGSITALPVAEAVMGDLSGYIQTNLMSITDGHIYFDTDLYNQGKRPAVNVFYSVTRVGRQAQSALHRDINQTLTSFMHEQENLRQFLHFGAELSDELRQNLALGDRLAALFDQPENVLAPINISIMLVGCLWASYWKNVSIEKVRDDMGKIISAYQTNPEYQKQINGYVSGSGSLDQLINTARENEDYILSPVK